MRKSCGCGWVRMSGAFGLVVVAFGALVALPAPAAEPALALDGEGGILLARHPAPSPDGTAIAFSYQGDIWIVPAKGGEARRLTAHPAYDANPVWSPDGAWIAFSSDRAGNDDVYALPVAGGELRRLTWNSAPDVPSSFTPDSRAVLFRSGRHIQDNDNPGIFCVSLDGGLPFPVLPVGGHDGRLSPNGATLAFARGAASWSRRGYRGNGHQRLWLCTLEEPLGASGSAAQGAREDPLGALRPVRNRPALPANADELVTSNGYYASGALRWGADYRELTAFGAVIEDPSLLPGGFWATWKEAAPDWAHPEFEPGVNRAAFWFPDGEHLLYLSEAEGVSNLKIVSTRTGRRDWVTRLDRGRLRYPALSANGRLAAFEYEDGIYVVRLPAELPPHAAGVWTARVPEPARLEIRIPRDARADAVEWRKIAGDARELKLSPGGKQLAFIAQGEVFVMKASEDEPYAYNVSQSPARETDIEWMPDSKTLLFTSRRDGQADIYAACSGDASEARLARAMRCTLTRLTSDAREEWRPRVSPDGERIAYLRGRGTLMVMSADGSGARELVNGPREMEFAWSPDSRWLVYTQLDDDYNSDVWIVPADGKDAPVNVSRHPDGDFAPCWSPDGKLLAFTSRREFLNQTDIWYVWLTREDEERSREERLDLFSSEPDTSAAGAGKGGAPAGSKSGAAGAKNGSEEGAQGKDAGKKGEQAAPPVVRIDFDGIHERLHRLTTFPGEETQVLVSKDGKEMVFIAENDGKRDLWKVKWDGSEPTRLTQGGQAPAFVQWNDKMDTLFFLNNGGKIQSVPLAGGETKSYGFAAELRVDLPLQRGLVFDEAWADLNAQFYDPHFHGCDWRAMHDRYRPWALAASTYRDFQDVLRMMMGELNASHLGIYEGPGDVPGRGDGLSAETGELGVVFDAAYDGPGARIARVVENSPAARAASRLAPGEVILAVNGRALAPGDDIYRDLERTVEKRVSLEVRGVSGERREVIIRPIKGGDFSTLLYDEQIRARRHRVAEASGGRLAYIHIRSMDEGSLDLFERDLYAQAHGKDALVIDVRDNGGGWTTDLLLTSLMAGDHATTIGRDGGPGYPEERRLIYAWTKPIVVLCDEASFSNAEIFPWSIRTLGRGPVIGQQTAGCVISTDGTTLLDGSFLRLPERGWYTKLNGANQEGTGCPPDIVVANLPGDLARGKDAQLERAIAEALKEIGK